MGPYVGILICCMVAVWYCCLIPMRQRYRSTVVRKRKIQKGIKKDMPVKMLNDYIGKECSITIMGELCGFKAVLLEVEENWIKVQEKKQTRIINGDMISYISVEK